MIGGYAVVLYTEPRYTKDLDIWLEASAENAERVFKALAECGAPLAGISGAGHVLPDNLPTGAAPSAHQSGLTAHLHLREYLLDKLWTGRR